MKNLQPTRRRRCAAVALAVALGVGAAGASTVNAEPGPKERPFHASIESDFVTVGTCDHGAPLQEITGTGHASHMGRIEIVGDTCLSQPTGFVTWTAANGDQIMMEFETVLGEIGSDGSASISMPAVVVVGTGKFANVSFGEGGALVGTVWFDQFGGGHIEAIVDGTIIYDASDRSR